MSFTSHEVPRMTRNSNQVSEKILFPGISVNRGNVVTHTDEGDAPYP
jgi:hypothetical protein